ncbi:MAG TPA: hypothetical protein P5277_04350 [Candidatus Paceibacterota bacterium]|nr:hypothetical protein [Candidatus Paceibacterota bacterium]
MKEIDSMTLLIDYSHNVYSCSTIKHKESEFMDVFERLNLSNISGFYKQKSEEIARILGGGPRVDIIQIVSLKPLNLLQLKKILGYSYSTIHDHIKLLQDYKLITLTKGKSDKGMKEIKVSLNKNILVKNITDSKEELISYLNQQFIDSKIGKEEFNSWLDEKIKNIANEKTIRNSTR